MNKLFDVLTVYFCTINFTAGELPLQVNLIGTNSCFRYELLIWIKLYFDFLKFANLNLIIMIACWNLITWEKFGYWKLIDQSTKSLAAILQWKMPQKGVAGILQLKKCAK